MLDVRGAIYASAGVCVTESSDEPPGAFSYTVCCKGWQSAVNGWSKWNCTSTSCDTNLSCNGSSLATQPALAECWNAATVGEKNNDEKVSSRAASQSDLVRMLSLAQALQQLLCSSTVARVWPGKLRDGFVRLLWEQRHYSQTKCQLFAESVSAVMSN